jgi:hypothetical protein
MTSAHSAARGRGGLARASAQVRTDAKVILPPDIYLFLIFFWVTSSSFLVALGIIWERRVGDREIRRLPRRTRGEKQ